MKPKLKYLLTSFILLTNSVFSQGIDDACFTKVIEIGQWDLDSYASKSVEHGIDLDFYTIIAPIEVRILSDTEDEIYFFNTDRKYFNSETLTYQPVKEVAPIRVDVENTAIRVSFKYFGFFDNSNFDRTDMNRGSLVIMYIKTPTK